MAKPLAIIFILLLAVSPNLYAQNKGVIFTAKSANGSFVNTHLTCPESAINTLLSTNLWLPTTKTNNYEYKNIFADDGYHKLIKSIDDQAIQLGCKEGAPIVRCFHLTWKPGSGQHGREIYHVYMSNNHPLHSFEGWVRETVKYWQNPVLTEVPEITDELECLKKGTVLKEKGKGPIICGVNSYTPDCIEPVK